MQQESNRVVVLRIRPFREHDALVTLFGEHCGKKTILVAGLKKGNSKKSGLFLPFSVLDVEFSANKNLPRLLNAELLCPAPSMEMELFSLMEISEKISSENQGNPDFFLLLSSVASAQNFPRIPPLFLVKSLHSFGFLSNFRFCAECNTKFCTDGFFENGGIFCRQCRKFGESLSFEEIKILHFWQKMPLSTAEKVDFSEEFGKKAIFLFSEFCRKEGISLKLLPFQ